MKTARKNQGFTLIEMLVVIAMIAVLVAIIIPVVASATTKAQAATDAANLRAVLGKANTLVMMNNADDTILKNADIEAPECKSFSGAKIKIMYVKPGFFDIYYVVNNADYYGLAYFSEVAETGSSNLKTDKSGAEAGYNKNITWYSIPHTAQEGND